MNSDQRSTVTEQVPWFAILNEVINSIMIAKLFLLRWLLLEVTISFSLNVKGRSGPITKLMLASSNPAFLSKTVAGTTAVDFSLHLQFPALQCQFTMPNQCHVRLHISCVVYGLLVFLIAFFFQQPFSSNLQMRSNSPGRFSTKTDREMVRMRHSSVVLRYNFCVFFDKDPLVV